MEGKRGTKRSSRASSRLEPPSKKRTVTPPDKASSPAATPVPTAPAAPSPSAEDALPRSISAGKPLPTVAQVQPDDLSSKDYQSVEESGVLAESLRRSKQRLLHEGVFEKYWTKPSRKKGQPENPNNPPKESMTKLGACTITIEPHIFEATMFVIKDTPSQHPQIPPPQPMYRPIIQYGPPGGVHMPPPPPTPQPPKQALPKPAPPPQASPQAAPASISPAPPKPAQSPTPAQSNLTATPPVPQTNVAPATRPPVPPTQNPAPAANGPNIPPGPGVPPAAHPPQPPPPAQPAPFVSAPVPAPPPPTTKTADPVIQMLAERAATDPELKSLMRVVADGEANNDQLRRFQVQIDELTALAAARRTPGNCSGQPTPRPTPPPAPSAQAVQTSQPFAAQPPLGQRPMPAPVANAPAANPPPPASPAPAAAPVAPPKPPTPVQAAPPKPPTPKAAPPPQPQALRSKGPVAPPKSDIAGVCFEFTGGSGDRFLFPKFSILEFLPDGQQVVASFLIVRKGSSGDSLRYDPDLDYYQPVTVRILAHSPRLLDTLAKVVAPPEKVREYMNDIMDHMTRAEYVLLAMRLPRESEKSEQAKGEEESEKEKEKQNAPVGDGQVLWTAKAEGARQGGRVSEMGAVQDEGVRESEFLQSVS